ncbi:MAG: PhoPQ-activated pathogenicity-related protein PqaA type [Verrucomicrobiales bacterium]|nr:PhoPQ-activated pathogenicity-related protein PqaA type [Verrucomicrobiales bacterium]
MANQFYRLGITSIIALLFGVTHLSAATPDRTAAGERTALDRYVHAVDTNYSFRVANTIKGDGYTTYMIDMISQSWLTTNEVNRPLWQHWLTLVKPDQVTSSTALLMIGGGANRTNVPTKADESLALVASTTKTVVAELRNVPNQPLIFAGEKKGRTEDSLIAYTWDKFLRTGDEKWPARLPMTKAAVRAMDTVTAFCASEEGGKTKVDKFFVAGASKRGWTTWTTAAVDNRVIAIAPIVIDLLNIRPSFHHHFEVYGFYAPAVRDYTQAGIMDWDGTPEYSALMKIEEPYEYRQRLTLPKFLINASGDQFFVPDSAQFYFKDLPGVKYLRYVPNADHSLRNSDALMSLLAYYSSVVTGAKLPQFAWTLEADGSIQVKAQDKPSSVKLWQASNLKARDFRLETIHQAWKSMDIQGDDGLYVAKVPKPEKGWTAFFAELTYESGLKFTTQVRVVPEAAPFKYQQPTRPKP